MPGFFSNTLAVLRREIYRVARQPMYWLLTVILPIVAFAFFAVLLYKGVARDIPIAVVDQDNSTLSRKVTQMIDATPTAWVAYGVQGMEEAERLMLLVIFKVVGVPLNGSLTVITISNLLFILSYQSLGAMIVTVLSNLRLSLSIGGGYSVLAFTFSGLTFPIMAMSKPMQWFCCIFPFTFYTDIMVDQALRGAPAIYSLPDMGIIALFIILPLLCLPRLRTICTNKKYWGRL